MLWIIVILNRGRANRWTERLVKNYAETLCNGAPGIYLEQVANWRWPLW